MSKLFIRDNGFYKNVAKIAIPIALQGLITSGVNAMDNYMVSELGQTSLSGVSMATQFITIFQIFCMGIGMGEGFTCEIAKVIINQYKEVYPELGRNEAHILEQLKLEEDRFQRTLKKGQAEFEKVYGNMARRKDAFEALKAITINPAESIGIADRVGSLEVGKDADIVITDGNPFDSMTNVELVLIEGEAV